MNNKLFKALLILVVLCLVLVTALFACSPRDKYPDDVVIKPGQTGNETTDVYKQTNYTFNESLERLKTITENASRFNSYSDTSEWFIIDTRIDYYFRDFEVVPNHIIDFTLVIKANINLLDNAKSELFFEYIDNQLPSSESLRFGVYYIAKAMYVDIAGEKFYADEVNLTEAGKLIVAPLSAMGLDVYSLVYGFVAGSTGIDMLDGILPLAKLVSSNDEGNVIERQIINKYSDSLEYEYTLRLNPVLSLLNSSLGDLISWDAFGLPDLDPLLTKVFGFGLSTLKTKAWPRMAAKIIFHSAKEDIPILDDDGNFTYDEQDNLITEKGYVFNGMTITIDTPITASQKKDYYDLSLQVMPLRLGLADKKTPINFSNYDLGDAYKGNIYQKALSLIHI